MQQLLADVGVGRIDIVVYKVDRLTRSLADFAKLVELFDAALNRSIVRVRKYFAGQDGCVGTALAPRQAEETSFETIGDTTPFDPSGAPSDMKAGALMQVDLTKTARRPSVRSDTR